MISKDVKKAIDWKGGYDGKVVLVYLGVWGRKIIWVWEFKVSRGCILRVYFIK